MILFNTLGPALFYVNDFTSWYPFGWAVASPQIKLLSRYQTIPSAATGESFADDYAWQGKEALIDVEFNLFDERLINFVSASAKWRFFGPKNTNDKPSMPPSAQNGGVGAAINQPNAQNGNNESFGKLDGIFDRLDYGSLSGDQDAGYPMCIRFLRFQNDNIQKLSRQGIPPGYTFFHVRPVTEVDDNIGTNPQIRRIIFQATTQRIDFVGEEEKFRAFNKKKKPSYPESLLNIVNYIVDPSYQSILGVNGTIRGGQALYVRGIPRNLPNIVTPSFFSGKVSI